MQRHAVSFFGITLLALAVIGAAAGDAVAADRTVLVEYFGSTG